MFVWNQWILSWVHLATAVCCSVCQYFDGISGCFGHAFVPKSLKGIFGEFSLKCYLLQSGCVTYNVAALRTVECWWETGNLVSSTYRVLFIDVNWCSIQLTCVSVTDGWTERRECWLMERRDRSPGKLDWQLWWCSLRISACGLSTDAGFHHLPLVHRINLKKKFGLLFSAIIVTDLTIDFCFFSIILLSLSTN